MSRNGLRFSYEVQDCIQSAHTKRFVSGNRDALGSRHFRLQINMASPLTHFPVVPKSAERLHEVPAAKVARSFHPIDSTSSRTNCKRMERRFGASQRLGERSPPPFEAQVNKRRALQVNASYILPSTDV